MTKNIIVKRHDSADKINHRWLLFSHSGSKYTCVWVTAADLRCHFNLSNIIFTDNQVKSFLRDQMSRSDNPETTEISLTHGIYPLEDLESEAKD